ncbi:hypothetical protein [Sphingomonas sp. ID0503]|uniref:hypothetical protein n=1 Tax=Sphingomonas sp. ID0503 TaxID=3399691 RepID=UPI003AFA6EEC
MARIYVRRHQSRAPILVGDHISRSIAAGRLQRSHQWRAVRDAIWKMDGFLI